MFCRLCGRWEPSVLRETRHCAIPCQKTMRNPFSVPCNYSEASSHLVFALITTLALAFVTASILDSPLKKAWSFSQIAAPATQFPLSISPLSCFSSIRQAGGIWTTSPAICHSSRFYASFRQAPLAERQRTDRYVTYQPHPHPKPLFTFAKQGIRRTRTKLQRTEYAMYRAVR